MRRTIRTSRARDAFLKTLADTCNISEACRVAGIGRQSAYDWRGADADFARAWADTEEAAGDKLEQVAFSRALSGESDRMLEILLKAHRPKYRDKQAIELTGKDGGPLEYREAARREIDELFGPTPIEIIRNG